MSLQWWVEQLNNATCPEDIFGIQTNETRTKESLVSYISDAYKCIAKQIHPDIFTHNEEKNTAEDAFRRLNNFHIEAHKKCEQGIYGDRTKKATSKVIENPHIMFASGSRQYTLVHRFAEGNTCGIFEGVVQDRSDVTTPVIVKIPHSADDNDLMEREARAYKAFARIMKPKDGDISFDTQILATRLPLFYESFRLEEPGSTVPKVITTFLKRSEMEDNWYTFAQIRKDYPHGIPTRAMVFLWNRMLEGLTIAHAAKIIHSHITPNHCLIHPETHIGQVVDWSASCILGGSERIPYKDERYGDFFVPKSELNNYWPTPETDIYMLANTILFIVGGNVEEKKIPVNVEDPFRVILNKCLQPHRRNRYHDVKTLHHVVDETAVYVFGRKKFIDFSMPKV